MKRTIRLGLLALISWYSVATLPYLSNSPRWEWAQMGIAAPAYKLATQGVYGNDLFTGFYETERYNYEYMPLYPLLVAGLFKLVGLGVFQARLASVLCGLAVILLTFWLGSQLYDDAIGLAAAAILCVVRLGVEPPTTPLSQEIAYLSGIPLLDFARVLRYDIMTPVWVLASCLWFVWATRHQTRLGYLATGISAGLATLSHIYGAFILAVLFCLLLWQSKARLWRSGPLYLMVVGWLLALLPWLLYIAQDVDAYQGQMLRHEARFNLLDWQFYWNNLRGEPARYGRWIDALLNRQQTGWHVGVWFLVAGVVGANLTLWRRLQRANCLADRLLFLAVPVLGLLLATLINLKRYPYTALLLPFLALQTGFAVVMAWRWSRRHSVFGSWALGLGLVVVLLEGGSGVVQSIQAAQATTPYTQLTQVLKQAIPRGSRVLLSQTYWLGLAQYDTRSINLAFVLSDPRYGYPYTPTLETVLQAIDSDYVVVEDYFVKSYVSANPQAVMQWQEFGAYLARQCAETVATVVSADYGSVRVYRCTCLAPARQEQRN